MEQKKIGRPSKGDRTKVSYRLPDMLLSAMSRYAAERGMTVTDLVGESVAKTIGERYMPQEGLPLRQAS